MRRNTTFKLSAPQLSSTLFFISTLLILSFSLSAETPAEKTLSEAIRNGNITEIKKLISNVGKEEINYPMQRDGGSWFAFTASNAKPDTRIPILKLLIDAGANPLLKNNQGKNALMSVYNPDEQILNYLIILGINVNDKDIQGNSALHTGIMNRLAGSSLLITKTLIKNKADLNSQNNLGITPLLLSVRHNKEKIFNLLLTSGANYEITDKQGAGILHYAVYSQNVSLINKALKLGVNINVQDNKGLPPISYAANSSQWSIVRFLLEKGADANAPTRKYGNLGLFLLESPDYGLAHLIDKNKINPDVTGKNQITPLERAIKRLKLEKIEQLLGFGADPNKVTPRTITSICAADFQSKPKRLDLCKNLIKHGLDINKTGKSSGDSSYLYHAVNKNNEAAVRFLLANKADPNLGMAKQTSWAITPLGTAVMRKRYSIAYALLEAGARTDITPESHWEYLNFLFRSKGSQAELMLVALMEKITLTDKKTLKSRHAHTIYNNLLNSKSENIRKAALKMNFIDNKSADMLAMKDFHSIKKPSSNLRSLTEKEEKHPAEVHKKKYSKQAELHLISIYEGIDPNDDGTPWWAKCKNLNNSATGLDCHGQMTKRKRETFGIVDIHFGNSYSPVILALSSYNKVIWKIHNPKNRKIESVILMGYYEQRVEGLSSNTSLFVHTDKTSDCTNCIKGVGYRLPYQGNSTNYSKGADFLRQATKKEISSYQKRKKEKSFWIK